MMKIYYQKKLDHIEEIQPKFKLTARPANHFRLALPQRVEDMIGIGITLCYLLRLLLPGNWFLISRCFSIFKIGF